MKTDRILIALVSVLVVLQATSFFFQMRRAYALPKPGANTQAVRDADKDAPVDFTALPAKGSQSAKVALIEFSDYECPFCSSYAAGTAKQIEKEYVQTGKVRLVFANNPLPIHPQAKSLATAAICAGNQGRYWEMHDALFNVKPRTAAEVLSQAVTLGLDQAKFQRCIDSPDEVMGRISKDQSIAQKLRLTGTPGFAVGRVEANGSITIKKLIAGAQPIEVFKNVLKEVESAN